MAAEDALGDTRRQSALVKVEVELLGDLVILLLDLHSYLADVALRAVVDATIIKDELHVLHELLNALILVILQLVLNRGEVHRILHHLGVVGDVELLPVDRIRKDVGLLIALYHGEHTLSGLFPLVENGRALRHLRHLELTEAFHLFAVLVDLEVLGNLRVQPLEFVELGVCHGRVQAALAQFGQHVASWDLPLVLDDFGLGRCNRLHRSPIGVCVAAFLDNATVLLEQCKDLLLALPFRVESRCDAFLVMLEQVGSSVDQVLDHFVLIVVDRVVNRPLVLSILVIEARAEVDELLRHADMTLAHRVVNARLPVLVLPVDGVAAGVAEVVNDGAVTFTRGVKERRLLELVFFDWIDAELDEHFEHLEGQVLVLDNAGVENGRLTEIFGLADQLLHVDGRLTHETNNLVDFTALDLVENGLMERVLLARLL